MFMLAAVMMVAVASGGMQEPGVPAAAPTVQQGQQGAPPVVSRDTVPTAPVQAQATPQQNQVFTVPAGTHIPLTLAQAVNPKHVRVGDAIRAATAFPVTVDGQVVMPAGVLLEGVVVKRVKRDRWGHPWVRVHFTRLVFPNGYVLPLDGETSEARATKPSENEQANAASDPNDAVWAHENGPAARDAFQSPQQPPPPTLPPLPKPNYGPAIGIGVGSAAAAVGIAIIASRHRYDEFWYGVGWQFDMVLQAPIRVDAANWNMNSPD